MQKMYKVRPHAVEAVKITVNNMEEVALWCGGEVKGYRLPDAYRSIEFYNRKGKQTARLNMWVYHEAAALYDFFTLIGIEFMDRYEILELPVSKQKREEASA